MSRTPLLSIKGSIVLSSLFLFFASLGSSASADHYREINRAARRIDSDAETIARESAKFVHSPNYVCMVNETAQLRQLACRIRDNARTGCDLYALQNDVATLGLAYRSVEAKVCEMERFNPNCHRTRRIRRNLNSVQGDVQRILSCLRNLLSRPVIQPMPVITTYSVPQPVCVQPQPVYGPPTSFHVEQHYHQPVAPLVPMMRSAELEQQMRTLRIESQRGLLPGRNRSSVVLNF